MPSFEIRNSKGLGAAIKHARTARGIRQEDLADDLNINRKYLVGLEKGTPNIWSTRLFRTLHKLGIKVTVTYELPKKAEGEDSPDA